MMMEQKRRPYTPEDVVFILRQHGTYVTIEEAKVILETMRNLAKLVVEQYFDK
jgi:uncharacterized protein YutE (UPF0331/DUF86 family)